MSQIDDKIESTPISTPDPKSSSELDQVVITMPAKLKRALVGIWHFIRSLFTGEVVLNPSVSKGYDYLAYIAVLLLINIITLFSSLHMEIRVNQLSERVRLLSERAVRTEEQRIKATTHSSIVKALEQRGIALTDCYEPVTIIKEK